MKFQPPEIRTKRIFIAIKVEAAAPLTEMIVSIKSVLRNERVKWVSINNMHLTIVFLGDTDEKMIDEICNMLNTRCTGTGSFDLTISSLGVFRNLHDPHVIWTGISQSEDLLRLNSTIIDGVKDLGIVIGERKFNPHLTLGRMKHINDKSALKGLVDTYREKEFQTVPVKEIILFESILSQQDPVYKSIASISL